MSFGIGSNCGSRDNHCIETIGTNGSGDPFLAQLFAGYVLGKHKEWKRVRNWIDASLPSIYVHELPAGFPYEFNHSRKIEDLKRLVAYEYDDCSWVKLAAGHDPKRTFTAERGLKLKAPKCPILLGLSHIANATFFCYRYNEAGFIPAKYAKEVYRAYSECVVPQLGPSPWASKMCRIGGVFEHAASGPHDIIIS